ncbi:MAG TPA: hypothetical protein VF665_16495 [Longimicrobium sp.]|uniref:hypothetical protein n=1 Tax=Longimicrobium sp. TaxID=2029185 RepID=UPI002EDB685D
MEGTTVEARDFIVKVQEPELRLECPDSVERGQSMSCTASAYPSGTLSNIAWSFTDSLGNVIPAEAGTGSTWQGEMVVSGTTRLSASLNGAPHPVRTASVTVTPRTWTGRLQYPAEPQAVITTAELRYPPVSTANPMLTHGVVGAMKPAEIGATYGEGTGPNAGWIYLNGPPVVTRIPRILHNRGFFPGDPFYAAQVGGPGRCDHTFMDSARNQMIAHEHEHFVIEASFFTSPDAARVAEREAVYDPAFLLSQTLLDQRLLAPLITQIDSLQAVWDSKDVLLVTCNFHTIS